MRYRSTAAFGLVAAALLAYPPETRASEAAGTEVVQGAPGTRLDIHLSALTERGFSGTVLVARKGALVLHKGYGLRDRRAKKPCTLDTVFDIASITKHFTAAAILKLEVQGKLRTTDPIAKHLPGIPPERSAITIHHLLTHTAGLESVYGEDDDYLPKDLAIKLFMRMPLLSRPGEKYSYSNPGFSLLAAIIESASGQSYEAYLREQLWKPAGMEQTGYVVPTWDLNLVSHNYDAKGESHGHTFNRNWGPDGPWWHFFGNGGILSTTGDFLKWDQALSAEKILPSAAREKLWTGHVKMGDTESFYGYGTVVRKTARGTRIVGHGGGSDWGVSTKYYRFPDDDVVVIAFSNLAGGTSREGSVSFEERLADLARME
jgi:CubicO group peptidase (beta-lactamase class C family)